MEKIKKKTEQKSVPGDSFWIFKKKENVFFIFLGFPWKGGSLPNREGSKKPDINEELWWNIDSMTLINGSKEI